jgi:polysaccharide pyruvyl transferase WcaK-like protein
MVTIFGYYGHNNAGDEAFRLAFDRAFAIRGTPVRYVSHPDNPWPADRPLIVGGGAVLNDYFLGRVDGVRALHIVGCSLPYGEGDVTRVARLGDTIRTLLVRSRGDVEVLRRAGLDAEFIPDLVFSLDPPARGGAVVSRALLESWTALPPRNWGRHDRTAIICLSDDYHVPYAPQNREKFERIEAFRNELAAALDAISEKFNILMLPFSVWHSARDYVFAHDVVRRMRRRDLPLVVERALPPSRLLEVIAAVEPGPVLSMKYHGLVFGMLADRVCISIGSTRKNRHLMQDAGLDGLSLPYERFTAAKLLSAVEKHATPHLLQAVREVRSAWGQEARERLAAFAAGFPADATA